ncbi:MAG: family 20 glycosylhydrolase [Fimbriimonadaceae bacterium]|nr:family 20 glycosylhydrolase [Fimbriimonadaceae bacterium]
MVALFALLSCLALERTAPLVPWPTEVKVEQGRWVSRDPTIVVQSKQALPLARVFIDDLRVTHEIQARIVDKVRSGSIGLRLGPGHGEEGYELRIDSSSATVTATTLRGLAHGLVTLVQASHKTNRGLEAPRLRIEDRPASAYRGLMIDVARHYHSIDVLKQCVDLCRFYKLNFLQLHLTDDQSFTFPSRAYPLVNSSNQHGGPSYTAAELKDLVRYADDRGVTIIPEFDIPGHSATLVRTMPDLFKIKGTTPYEHHASINFANPEVVKAVDTLIGEMCEVFESSPYFHMGGDEADIAHAHQHPNFQAAFREFGLPDRSQHEIFRRFLTQVNQMVKKRGKKLIVWEGFGRNPESKFPIPKDVLVMAFENAYYLPNELLKDGYTVINASWTPLYVVNRHVWPAKKVFEWDLSKFGRFSNLYDTTTWFTVPEAQRILGAQICSWEGPEESEIENLRRVVPAMAERVWSRRSATWADFEPRLTTANTLFERLVHPVTLHSSALDALDPNGFDVPCFTLPLTVTMRPNGKGVVRYTLDAKPPTSTSPIYTSPLKIQTTTTVRAALFNQAGKRLGYESSRIFYHVPPRIQNLATGKKVTVSGGTQGPQALEFAVDGNLDLASSWWTTPAPQWLQVDLGKRYRVDRIEVFPYWDGSRYYQYTVEASEDGLTWSMVGDRSTNTVPSSVSGDSLKFSPRTTRFVKVNLLHNSANEAVHLVELKVWEARD